MERFVDWLNWKWLHRVYIGVRALMLARKAFKGHQRCTDPIKKLTLGLTYKGSRSAYELAFMGWPVPKLPDLPVGDYNEGELLEAVSKAAADERNSKVEA